LTTDVVPYLFRRSMSWHTYELPCHAGTCPALPYLAMPGLAPPYRAMPDPAMPCKPDAGEADQTNLALPCVAGPSRTLPRLTRPCQAQPSRAEPDRAGPCKLEKVCSIFPDASKPGVG
jgi:hypothetical protein